MKSFDLAANIIMSAIKEKKYNVISECSKIVNPDKCDIVCESYTGDGLRIFKNKGCVNILIPEEMSFCESEYIANAVQTGSLFDDVEEVEDASNYVIKTTLPVDSIINQNVNPPTDALLPAVGSVVGKIGDNGLEIDDTAINNGHDMVKDFVTIGNHGSDPKEIIDNYLSIKDRGETPDSLNKDTYEIKTALDELNKYDPDEALPDVDMVDSEVEVDTSEVEDEYGVKQEGFLSRKPKKLKPIPAQSIISYITVEMNAIRDTNDQAMLSGYVCSKLETADFYLSCIDNNDGKYIVPHDRAFIVRYQTQLNQLLSQILKIKPINRNDRVWQVNVTYPDGFGG